MSTRAVDKFYHRVNHLFSETLQGGFDSWRAWNAVSALHRTGSRLVFAKAQSWCHSPISTKRGRAATILSQLRRPSKAKEPFSSISEPVFADESFSLIAEMFTTEQDIHALRSEIYAFGHLHNLAAVPLIIKCVDHPSELVRHALAFTLGSLHEHPDSTPALTKLSDDTDKDVCDWAIFGLGVLGDADSEELRQLFLAHLDDPFLDARIEAAASLGKRHDARLAAPLIRLLKKDGPLSGLIEAANDLLEMDDYPPDWYAREYITALKTKFIA